MAVLHSPTFHQPPHQDLALKELLSHTGQHVGSLVLFFLTWVQEGQAQAEPLPLAPTCHGGSFLNCFFLDLVHI